MSELDKLLYILLFIFAPWFVCEVVVFCFHVLIKHREDKRYG